VFGGTLFARQPVRCWRIRAGFAVLICLCGTVSLWGAGDTNEPSDTNHLFRVAFSTSMFTEVNESDARAAMKVWILTVAQERGIPTDPEPRMFDSVEAILQSPQINQLDGFAVTTEEFSVLSRSIECDRLAIGVHGGSITEQYVILAHADSGLNGIEDLRGHSLIILQSPRMSLATVWLDTLLLEKGLPPAARFCGRISYVNKPSRVALPVFFRQADVCIITRKAFETMIELNPQIGKQLRVVATSPELIPSFFAFRANRVSPFRQQMLTEMQRLQESPAGRQILALTQADSISEQSVSCLADSLELLVAHRRLCSGTNSADAAALGLGLLHGKAVKLSEQ
jgi:ABC-type phosphate/phosphonate transport system substrate-binding protein